MLERDSSGQVYVIDGSEFDAKFPDLLADQDLEPLARLFVRCKRRLTDNPVFWCRLVGYTYACSWYLERHGQDLGFAARRLDVQQLLGGVDDPQILDHLSDYPGIFDRVIDKPL